MMSKSYRCLSTMALAQRGSKADTKQQWIIESHKANFCKKRAPRTIIPADSPVHIAEEKSHLTTINRRKVLLYHLLSKNTKVYSETFTVALSNAGLSSNHSTRERKNSARSSFLQCSLNKEFSLKRSIQKLSKQMRPILKLVEPAWCTPEQRSFSTWCQIRTEFQSDSQALCLIYQNSLNMRSSCLSRSP